MKKQNRRKRVKRQLTPHELRCRAIDRIKILMDEAEFDGAIFAYSVLSENGDTMRELVHTGDEFLATGLADLFRVKLAHTVVRQNGWDKAW